MADREVAVGDPDAVAPTEVGGGGVHVHVGGADIGDGGEDDGVEAEAVHPLLQVDLSRALQAAKAVFELGHVAPGDARVRSHPVGIARQVVVEAVVAVGEGAGGVREDQRAVDVGERVQLRVAVGGEEVVPRPRRQVEDLAIQVGAGHEPPGEDRRRSGPVAFVVRHGREVDLDDLRPGGGQRRAGLLPQRDDRRARLDALSGRPADAGCRSGPGIRVGVDVHTGHADPPSRRRRAVGQGGVRRGAHRGRARQRHPRLCPPEVAARFGVVRDDDVEDLQQIGHRARVRHDDVLRGHQRPVAACGDDAARGCVGAQRVVRGRPASARPGLLAEAERGERGRRRRSGAVRGARGERGGEPIGGVGALGAAVEPALHAAAGHRRHVGQPQADGTPGAQPLDREGVALRDERGEGGRAGCRGQPADEVAVLRGVRDAVQRREHLAAGAAGVGGGCFRVRVGVAHDDRVERGRGVGSVVGVDAREVGLDELDGGRAPRLEGGAQLGDRGFDDVDHRRTSCPPSAGCC